MIGVRATIGDMRRYLLREQGYEKEVVYGMDPKELRETYNYYHEYY